MKASKTKKSRKTASKLGKAGLSQKSGLPPGSLIHIGEKKTHQISIDMILYNSEVVEEKKDITLQEALEKSYDGFNRWIKITGLHDTELIGTIGNMLNLDNLLLEDILNTGQRPKVEFGNDHVFFTFRTLFQEAAGTDINSDQISLVLKDKLLVTFHESELSLFDALDERIKFPDGRIRLNNPDYLFYAVIDIVVDQYFKVIENLGDAIDKLEELLFELPDHEVLDLIQQNRRDLLYVKKSVFPVREAINSLMKFQNNLINGLNIKYFNDVYDHVLQMVEIIETYRELNAGIRDIFLSTQSNRMNKVMQLLTIIATIFIPLTFIVGIYGMNFEYLPELHWKYGYPLVWLVMLAVVLAMLFMFRKRKWL
ncbi:MAG: magnesium/cobalt transporter CorA [Bacteroidales bacterium]|nr:magnesium/cobalt transporter CorA [Bacteroidales bacterium]